MDTRPAPAALFSAPGERAGIREGVSRALVEEARRLGEEGIDPELWRRLKRAAYGGMVRQLNSFQNLCVEQAEGFFRGYDYLTFPEVFDQITPQDAQQLLRRVSAEGVTAVSVIRPRGGEA